MAYFYENFTGTDDQKISARTGWSIVGSEGQVVYIVTSNQCRPALKGSGSGGTVYRISTAYGPDAYIQVTQTRTTCGSGNHLCCTLRDANNWVGASMVATGDYGLRLYKNVSGTQTLLYQGPATGIGDTFGCWRVGTTVGISRNGTTVGMYTESSLSTETYQGMIAQGSSSTPIWDDLYADTLSSNVTFTVDSPRTMTLAQEVAQARTSSASTGTTWSDDFTGSDGQALEARDGWSLLGSEGAYAWRIFSDGIRPRSTGAGSGGTAYSVDTSVGAEAYVQITISRLAALAGCAFCCNISDFDNWIGFRMAGAAATGCRLTRKVSGTATDLITCQGALGDTFKVTREGSTVKLFQNGTQVGTDKTDTTFQSVNRCGTVADSNSTNYKEFDDFACGSMVNETIITCGTFTMGFVQNVATAELLSSPTILAETQAIDLGMYPYGGIRLDPEIIANAQELELSQYAATPVITSTAGFVCSSAIPMTMVQNASTLAKSTTFACAAPMAMTTGINAATVIRGIGWVCAAPLTLGLTQNASAGKVDKVWVHGSQFSLDVIQRESTADVSGPVVTYHIPAPLAVTLTQREASGGVSLRIVSRYRPIEMYVAAKPLNLVLASPDIVPDIYSNYCDSCGKKLRTGEGRLRWDGMIVCDEDFEDKHPQDDMRVLPTRPSKGVSRPEQAAYFVGKNEVKY